MANPLFMAGVEMLQGGLLGGGSAGAQPESDPRIVSDQKLDAALRGGAMNVSFGSEGTNYLLIGALVLVVILFLRR